MAVGVSIYYSMETTTKPGWLKLVPLIAFLLSMGLFFLSGTLSYFICCGLWSPPDDAKKKKKQRSSGCCGLCRPSRKE